MRNFILLKMMLVAIVLVIGSVSVWGQVNIIPIHTGAISVFTSWSYTICTTATSSSNDYIKMISNTSKVITPSMNFSQYYNHKLDFKAATFGTVTDAKKTITISISTNNGIDWTTLGTRLPGTSTLTSVIQFDISSYTGNNILIKFESLGADGANGVRLDDIKISGIVAQTCTPSTLAFTNTTVNKTMADAAFIQAATSLNGTTAIAYTSNNTSVATVSETSGAVTLVSAGIATITATQVAGTHSAVNYCAATATYTLNVASILPTITITEVTVPAMVAFVGNTVTETVNVSGVNLAENLTVSIIDDVNNQFNEPSVTSITKLGDNTATGTVTITYRPTAAGAHTATLKIESLGATSVTRALSGSGIDPNNPYSLDISSPVSEINETFEAPTAVGFVMPSNWKNVNVVGTKSWEVKLFNTNQYAQMSAFSSTSTQQTMLVSPAIDFEQIAKNNITFDWLAGFAKVGTTLKVYTMTLDGTKTEVKSININVPTSGYATVFTTETLNLSATNGIKFLVFEYNGDGGATALTTTYQLDNINVQKDLNTGLTNTNNHLEVILVNGNIKFSALAGESVEVYSAVGQKLVQKLTVSGLNTIPVSARGVVLVRVGNRFAKVIL